MRRGEVTIREVGGQGHEIAGAKTEVHVHLDSPAAAPLVAQEPRPRRSTRGRAKIYTGWVADIDRRIDRLLAARSARARAVRVAIFGGQFLGWCAVYLWFCIGRQALQASGSWNFGLGAATLLALLSSLAGGLGIRGQLGLARRPSPRSDLWQPLWALLVAILLIAGAEARRPRLLLLF